MTSKAWIVYRHTSPSGKVYIGITSDLPKRRWGNGMLQIHTLLKLYKSMGERILHMKFYTKDCTYEKELIAFYKKGGII